MSGLLGTTEVHGTHLSKWTNVFYSPRNRDKGHRLLFIPKQFSSPFPSYGATLGSEANCQDYLCGTTKKRDISISSPEAS